jgi:hypothetical protein
MKIGWGWKVAVLYISFVVMMGMLVVASSRQQFDLVSKEYYRDEIAYQKVLDASKNQAALNGSIEIDAAGNAVVVRFPEEFRDRVVQGEIFFYAAVDPKFDREFVITLDNNTMAISKSKLIKTPYTVKLSYTVDGKSYYQESKINL